MDRLVLRDAEGRAYCGRCGATRNSRGVLFADLGSPEQGVRGHLKTCRGRQGLEDKKAELAARLAAPPLPVPDREPVFIPAETARLQPAGSRSQPARMPYSPTPYRSTLAGHQPADAVHQRLAGLEAQFSVFRDQVTLARHESDRYREIAEDALLLAGNHEPHLALAAAENDSVAPVVYVLGAVVAFGLLGWALGIFGGDTPEESRPVMGTARPGTAGAPGIGNLLDVGSKVLGFVKNARGAFKV